MRISFELGQLSDKLARAGENQCVRITQDASGVQWSVRSRFWRLIPEWLLFWMKEENRAPIDYFHQVFGKRRIERICTRYGLQIERNHLWGRPLRKRDVEQLFLGLAEVFYEDIQDLHAQVNGTQPVDGSLAQEVVKESASLKGSAIEELTKENYGNLYKKLVPFTKIEHIFLNSLPDFGFRAVFAGKEEMRRQRIALCERVRLKEDFDPNVWRVWAAKSMFKRGEKSGLVILAPHGAFKVQGELESGGASLLLLKSLTKGVDSIIKAQGTRTNIFSKDALRSILDDLAEQIGLNGYKTLRPYLRYLLGRHPTDPRAGAAEGASQKPEKFERYYRSNEPVEAFRNSLLHKGMEKVEILAFSLGCAQAQHFIQRDPDMFARATLICPPGVSRRKCIEYSTNINGPELWYGMEIDDRVHWGGENKLQGADPTKVKLLVFGGDHLSREQKAEIIKNPGSVPKSTVGMLWEFLWAFGGPHVRHTSVLSEEGAEPELFELHKTEQAPVVLSFVEKGEWEAVRVAVRERGLRAINRWKGVAARVHSLFCCGS